MKNALQIFGLRFNHRTHSGLLADNDSFRTAEIFELKLTSEYTTIWNYVQYRPIVWVSS